jgi:small subunit ribosomal protein S6
MAQNSTAPLAGYETTFITRSEISDDAQKALVERLQGVVASFGGEVVLSEDWGRRKLAYPIQKESRGLYTYVVYTGKGDVVHEMERNLRLNEHVLRFLTVNLQSEFDAEAFRKRRADIHAAAKRREEEREARREERNAERRGYDMSEERGAPADESAAEGSEE